MSHVKGHYRIVEGKLVWVNEHEREGGAGEKFSLFGGPVAKKEEPAPAPEPAKQEPKPEPKAEAKPKVSAPKPDQEVAATGSELDHGLEAPESKEDLTKQHFTDVGKKIGGAAKDMAALKAKYYKQKLAVTLDDLESMEADSPELAAQLMTKEQQLGSKAEFIQTMKNQGASPGTAYAAGRIYTAIADPIDTPAGRKAFALGLNRIQEAVSTWKNLEDVANGLDQLQSEIKGFWMNAEDKATYDKMAEDSKSLSVSYAQAYKSGDKDLAAKLYQAKYQLLSKLNAFKSQKASDALNDPSNPKKHLLALGENFKKMLTSYTRLQDVAKKSAQIEKTVGWEFAEKKGKEEGEAPKGKQKKPWHGWVKPEPEVYEKEGGVSGDQIYVAQTLKDLYGIKGIEYGNWMDKDASQHHTQACGEALADLAFVLGMDPKEVSLNGRLSIAFGARGKGGAKAHYELDKKVVNMTKMAGGGSLAHEWGHALDNIMAMVSTGGASHHLAMISDNNGVTPGADVPQEVRDAFKGVYDAMHQGTFQATKEEVYQPDATHNKGTLNANGKAMLAAHGGDAQKTFDDYAEKYAHIKKWKPKKYATMMKTAAQLFASASNQPVVIKTPTGTPTSHFVATGNMMGEYWGRKHELFARAWESFVMDKMTEKGMKNTYLVSGVGKEHAEAYGKTLDVLEPHGGKTSVYPLGEERQNINAAFEKLVAALNTHKMFAKAISILNMRSLFN